MHKMITNTSCLIALSNIGRLELLHQVYGTVWATPEVAKEFGEELPDWVRIASVADAAKTKIITGTLDLGESSTIALAIENEGSTMILDDGKARRYARSLGLRFTGTLGVVIKAKQLGFDVDLTQIMDDFRGCGFRIPKDVEKLLLDL